MLIVLLYNPTLNKFLSYLILSYLILSYLILQKGLAMLVDSMIV